MFTDMPNICLGISTGLSNMTQDIQKTYVHPVYQQATWWGCQDGSKNFFICEWFLTSEQLKWKQNTYYAIKKNKGTSV